MHIQCLICYCFYPTGWNSKGKNSELSVSFSSPAFSSLFSSSPHPPIQSHFNIAGHPDANCTVTNTKYSEHIFSLASTFVNLSFQLDKLSRYVCPGKLWPFGFCGQASAGNAVCHMVTGSDRFVPNWRLIDEPMLFLLVSIHLIGLGFPFPGCSR